MDVLITVALLALVYWAVALAAVSFGRTFVKLLSELIRAWTMRRAIELKEIANSGGSRCKGLTKKEHRRNAGQAARCTS
jgi:hypothetical protein